MQAPPGDRAEAAPRCNTAWIKHPFRGDYPKASPNCVIRKNSVPAGNSTQSRGSVISGGDRP